MNNIEEIWTPIIEMPKNACTDYDPTFWGMDEREVSTGNKAMGFFIDIETYDEKLYLTLFFQFLVYGVRWTDEAGRHNTAFYLRQKDPNFGSALVYAVEPSKYASWLYEESSCIYGDDPKHYAVITTDNVIDVLCKHPPVVLDYEEWHPA